jgi:hypothetical protein
MRIILTVCICSLFLTGIMSAQSKHYMNDPLFGISYDPQIIKFDNAPSSISRFCSGLRGRRLWIYAYAKTADAEYFIVSGFRQLHPDCPGPVGVEPDFGIAVSLRDKKCVEDQSEYFLRGEINRAKGATPISATEAILNEIALDALCRYSRAFGSKANFLKRLSKDDQDSSPPVLRRQLELFRAPQ